MKNQRENQDPQFTEALWLLIIIVILVTICNACVFNEAYKPAEQAFKRRVTRTPQSTPSAPTRAYLPSQEGVGERERKPKSSDAFDYEDTHTEASPCLQSPLSKQVLRLAEVFTLGVGPAPSARID